jgi:hypothetical protein
VMGYELTFYYVRHPRVFSLQSRFCCDVRDW